MRDTPLGRIIDPEKNLFEQAAAINWMEESSIYSAFLRYKVEILRLRRCEEHVEASEKKAVSSVHGQSRSPKHPTRHQVEGKIRR